MTPFRRRVPAYDQANESWTASRTGFLALGIILVSILVRSKHKVQLILIVIAACSFVFGSLNELQRDRFLSIYRSDVKGAGTAKGRTDATWSQFGAGMARPVFGHGLGTSLELNAHTFGIAQPAHNLYAETFEELGGVGLIIILALVISIAANFRSARRELARMARVDPYTVQVVTAMQVWLIMNIAFSLASYGLSSYEWYLFAGLSVVVRRIAQSGQTTEAPAEAGQGSVAAAI